MSYLRGFSIYSLGLSKYFYSRRRNTIILLILAIPVFLSLLVLMTGRGFISNFSFIRQVVIFGFGFYNVYAVMIILFFATHITRDEINDKTLSYFLHSPISREEVFLWKFLSFISYSILIYVFMEILFFITFSLPNLTLLSSNPENYNLSNKRKI
ncbi:MAG: hypothetical protein HeimC3_40450 [Candidatus Heimdallarchaeota archaeon LC_3]|nr:MAG: hypothetical protein HeimC3_40450 [Candidatus Heimdallarchaeota archaeon LC_3]